MHNFNLLSLLVIFWLILTFSPDVHASDSLDWRKACYELENPRQEETPSAKCVQSLMLSISSKVKAIDLIVPDFTEKDQKALQNNAQGNDASQVHVSAEYAKRRVKNIFAGILENAKKISEDAQKGNTDDLKFFGRTSDRLISKFRISSLFFFIDILIDNHIISKADLSNSINLCHDNVLKSYDSFGDCLFAEWDKEEWGFINRYFTCGQAYRGVKESSQYCERHLEKADWHKMLESMRYSVRYDEFYCREKPYEMLYQEMDAGNFEALRHYVRCEHHHEGGNSTDLKMAAGALLDVNAKLYVNILNEEEAYARPSYDQYFISLPIEFVDDFIAQAEELKRRRDILKGLEISKAKTNALNALSKHIEFINKP